MAALTNEYTRPSKNKVSFLFPRGRFNWSECCFSSVQFSRSVKSDSLWPHGLQHAPWTAAYQASLSITSSCPSSQWCHPTISSSVASFSPHLPSFPASGSFLMSQLFTSGGQSTAASASASVLPMNIQGWFPLGLIGLLSSQMKRQRVLLMYQVFVYFNLDQFSGCFFFLIFKIYSYRIF